MNIQELESSFEEDFSHLKEYGAQFNSVGRELEQNEKQEDFNSETTANPKRDIISIWTPFIFNRKKIPTSYKGFKVQVIIKGNDSTLPIHHPNYLPIEFEVDPNDEKIKLQDYWAKSKFIAFVERCENEIKAILKETELVKEELVEILSYGIISKLY